jgi:DNA-binding transcriptional LysR family regulator
MNTSRLDLNLLRVFAAIYESRTLTLAAKQVGLSQPALSHALKRLRETFEDELFVRKGGVYVPTRKSEELAEPIIKALDGISNILEAPNRFDPETTPATFRLAISDFGSHTILPPLSYHLHKQASKVQCIVSQLSIEQYVHHLQTGEIDVAIISQPSDHPDIQNQLIMEENVVYIVREDHPDTDALTSLEGFSAADHLLVNLSGGSSSGLDKLLAERGHSRQVKLVVPYFSTVPEIVAKTNLIGGLPHRLALQAVKDHPVKIIPPPFELPPIRFHMHWHARRRRDTKLRWFRNTVKTVCISL